MLYEKSREVRASRYKRYTITTLLIMLMIAELFYLFLPDTFWGPIKLIDVINALAQFATAGAFYLGFHQFRKNRESERQSALVTECKALILKIQDLISKIKLGDDASIENLSNTITKLSNTATDFNAIFEELNEDIHKAIVRMHWQDMYFNSFSQTIKQINLSTILTGCGVSAENYLKALANAKREIEMEQEEPFYEYLLMKKIIESEYISNQFKPKGKLEGTFIFNLYYFDNHHLNDLLYGCMNIIDIRIKAPALAVLFEKLKILNIV